MLWAKDVVAAAGLLSFIVCAFALAGIAGAAFS